MSWCKFTVSKNTGPHLHGHFRSCVSSSNFPEFSRKADHECIFPPPKPTAEIWLYTRPHLPHCVLLSVGDVVRLGGPALARSDLALGPGAGRGGDPARDTGRCGHVPFHLAARGRSAVPPARWRDNGGFTGSPGQAGMWGPRRARRSAERRAQSRGCCSGSVFTGLRGGHDQHAGAA
jgi:hypothetical protein